MGHGKLDGRGEETATEDNKGGKMSRPQRLCTASEAGGVGSLKALAEKKPDGTSGRHHDITDEWNVSGWGMEEVKGEPLIRSSQTLEGARKSGRAEMQRSVGRNKGVKRGCPPAPPLQTLGEGQQKTLQRPRHWARGPPRRRQWHP